MDMATKCVIPLKCIGKCILRFKCILYFEYLGIDCFFCKLFFDQKTIHDRFMYITVYSFFPACNEEDFNRIIDFYILIILQGNLF